MAWDLTTYAGLNTAIADTLNRKDLTDQIPGFITLFEAKASRNLLVRDQQKRVETTTADDFIPVPSDFSAPYSLQLNVNGTLTPRITFVGEDEAEEHRTECRNSGYVGAPGWYTIFGGYIEVIPAPTVSYSYDLRYYARVPKLTGTANWLLTKAPDAYLYGACAEAAPFLKNDERIAVWGGLRDQAFEDMRLESERATRPQGGGLRAKPRGF